MLTQLLNYATLYKSTSQLDTILILEAPLIRIFIAGTRSTQIWSPCCYTHY